MSQWPSESYTNFPQVTQLVNGIGQATDPNDILTSSCGIIWQVTFSPTSSFPEPVLWKLYRAPHQIIPGISGLRGEI